MKLLWSASALQDFEQAIAYIANKNPAAAERVASTIDRTARALRVAQTGRRGRVPGTYEKVARGLPYIIVYAIDVTANSVVILHVIHGARDWPPGRWPR